MIVSRFEIFCRAETEDELLNRVKELKDKISSGFDIDHQNKDGDTELHMYVKDNFSPPVRVYCEAGANVNIKDNNGNTPLKTAISNKNKYCINNPGKETIWHDEIISILLKHGGAE